MLIISVVHTRTVSSNETRSFAVARCEMYAKSDLTSVYSPTSPALFIYPLHQLHNLFSPIDFSGWRIYAVLQPNTRTKSAFTDKVIEIKVVGLVIGIQFKRITQHKLVSFYMLELQQRNLKSRPKVFNKLPDAYKTAKIWTLTVEL